MYIYEIHADLGLLIKASSDEEMQDIITSMFDNHSIDVSWEEYEINRVADC